MVRFAISTTRLNCPDGSRAQCARVSPLNPALYRVHRVERLGFFKEAAAQKVCLSSGPSGQQMKISLTIQKILHLVKIGIAVTTLASLPACASSSWIKQADSGLPIEAVHSGSGTIISLRTHETSDRLFVAGLAKPHQLMRPMHVDIQLIDANSRVIAEKTDDLDTPWDPQISSSRHGRQSYVVSFPLSDARQAVKIRVVYHSDKHREGSS